MDSCSFKEKDILMVINGPSEELFVVIQTNGINKVLVKTNEFDNAEWCKEDWFIKIGEFTNNEIFSEWSELNG